MIIAIEKYKDFQLYYISESLWEDYNYAYAHNVGKRDTANVNIPGERMLIVFLDQRYMYYSIYASTSLGYVRKLRIKDDGRPYIDEYGDYIYETLHGKVDIFEIGE